jgi:hypothetical protein
MARITVTIPDEQAARVRQAFANVYGYQETVPDPANPGQMIDNPETKIQFAERKVREYVYEVTTGHEATKAADTARKNRIDQNRTDLILS